MRRPANVSQTFVPSASSTYAIPGFSLNQQIVTQSSLASVTFGKSLETVDAYAFWKCGALTTLSFPSTLKTIGDGAFWMCSGLNTVTFPASMDKIGELAFYHCYKLQDVVLPEGAEMGDYIFAVDEENTGEETEAPTEAE